jgi:hypothetical protein
MLAVLCAGLFASEEDAEGCVFIDWDPSHFMAVLTYLREGPSVALNMVEKADRRALNRELLFYGLPEVNPTVVVFKIILVTTKLDFYN